MAPATLRTLSKVKSSAMTPRHPSVPNLISAIKQLELLNSGDTMQSATSMFTHSIPHLALDWVCLGFWH
jgi:hypothetical protein